jgi:hypothetical protein
MSPTLDSSDPNGSEGFGFGIFFSEFAGMIERWKLGNDDCVAAKSAMPKGQ